MRYKTKEVSYHQVDTGPTTSDIYLCLHCNRKMYTPFRVNLFGWLLASCCALMGFLFQVAIALTVCKLLFFEHDPSVYLVVFLIPAIISAAIVFYIRQWFGRWAGYHSWLKWVKEHGSEENPGVGLVHVAGLTNLVELNLSFTPNTAARLTYLKDMPNLQDLRLNFTQVTDADLVHLKGLTSLRKLYLTDTKVTDAGIAELQKALPNCKIDK